MSNDASLPTVVTVLVNISECICVLISYVNLISWKKWIKYVNWMLSWILVVYCIWKVTSTHLMLHIFAKKVCHHRADLIAFVIQPSKYWNWFWLYSMCAVAGTSLTLYVYPAAHWFTGMSGDSEETVGTSCNTQHRGSAAPSNTGRKT